MRTYNDSDRAYQVLPSDKPRSSQENEDAHWYGCNGQGEFGSSLSDNDNELDGEAEEEEKVEFQQCDIDLVLEIASFHSQVGRDALVDGPGKFIVEFPGAAGQKSRSHSNDSGYGDQERLCVAPNLCLDEVVLRQLKHSVLDLRDLDRTVNKQANIVHDQANDLDSILHSQSIPDQEQLVEEAEYV